MAPLRLLSHDRIYGPTLAFVAVLTTLSAVTPAMAELGDVGFEFKISEKELVLANPGDMGVMKFAAWDAPYQRISNRNMPFLEVKNLDDSTGNLTEFSITIGDEDYNFSDDYFGDYVVLSNTTPGFDLTASVNTGDPQTEGDLLTVSIGNGGLAPGELVRFGIDLDPDEGIAGLYPHPDFRLVLFQMNGDGMSDNSIVSAMFEDPNDSTMTASVSAQLEDYVVTGPPADYHNQILRPYSVMEGVDVFGLEVKDGTMIPEPATASLAGLAMIGLAVWWRHRR